MRRADWLIPYSHDHQHGLAHALRLRRAVESDDDLLRTAAVTEVLQFGRDELEPHMHREEAELLPIAAGHGCVTSDQVARMANEHLRLRTLLARLADLPTDTSAATELAALLHDHIRWEERELFEAWQAHTG